MGTGMIIWYIFGLIVCSALAVFFIKGYIGIVQHDKEVEKKRKEMLIKKLEASKKTQEAPKKTEAWTVTSTLDVEDREDDQKTE